MVTDISTLNPDKIYSYADYLTWQFKERIELFKGRIFEMSPAPSTTHQRVSRSLTRFIDHYYLNKSCEYFTAPFDVRLLDSKESIDENEIHTVVQPDICVICDESKLDERGCFGAPDLVIEIISPGNSKKEMLNKFNLYEENKVKEYWLVDYVSRTILLYVLQGEKFIGLKPFTDSEEVTSKIFPELTFAVKDIFED